MKSFSFVQGSPEWLAHRRKTCNASDAPAMMGASPYCTRAELLRMIAAGGEAEFSDFVRRRVLDRGHTVEAKARPIAEEIIGEELYQVTVTDDEGRLGASLDGLTLGGVAWECKQWNEQKAADVRAGVLPEQDRWQVVQCLLVTGASELMYMVTDGTKERTVHLCVTPDQDDFAALEAGWRQFEADLAAYEPQQALEPEKVGASLETLPALRIEVEGRVLATNLQQYRDHAVSVFDSINIDLQTDQDFADAERAVKWCKDVEDRLKSAKEAALAQTASIDELFRAIDDISESARQKRLSLDKLVKARKDARKQEIQEQAVAALGEQYQAINATLTHGVQITYSPSDMRRNVGEAMKGKRTIQSMMDAAHQALTDAKLMANQAADRIRANLVTFPDIAGDNQHLFPDLRSLVDKAPDDFAAAVKLRISEHEQRMAIKAENERKAQEAVQSRAEAETTPAPEPIPERQQDSTRIEPEAAQAQKFTLTATFQVEAVKGAEQSRLAAELLQKLRDAGFRSVVKVQ